MTQSSGIYVHKQTGNHYRLYGVGVVDYIQLHMAILESLHSFDVVLTAIPNLTTDYTFHDS